MRHRSVRGVPVALIAAAAAAILPGFLLLAWSSGIPPDTTPLFIGTNLLIGILTFLLLYGFRSKIARSSSVVTRVIVTLACVAAIVASILFFILGERCLIRSAAYPGVVSYFPNKLSGPLAVLVKKAGSRADYVTNYGPTAVERRVSEMDEIGSGRARTTLSFVLLFQIIVSSISGSLAWIGFRQLGARSKLFSKTATASADALQAQPRSTHTQNTAAPPAENDKEKKDFFISYNTADHVWASWIAWALEDAGYQVVIDRWDFRPGGNFVIEMQAAATGTHKTIAVLSENYLQAEYTQPEWAEAIASDPRGHHRRLIPVRIAPCRPPGLLLPLIYIDLVGLSEDEALAALLRGIAARGKPLSEPLFPGESARPTTPQEEFPGAASSASDVWKEKLEFLRNQEAKVEDEAERSTLQQSIQEAEEKLRQLGQ